MDTYPYMKKTGKKKQTRDAKGRFKRKSYGDPDANIWTPMGGRTGYGSGSWGNQDQPTPFDLLGAYEDVAYACVSLIAENISTLPIRLCATTEEGQAQPKSKNKSINRWDRERINKDYGRYTRKAADVVEVTDHPILNLIDHPNPLQSWSKLLNLTVTYMELIGSAFWYLAKDTWTGEIKEIYLLPSHLVKIELDEQGAVKWYIFNPGQNQEEYYPDKIIHFRHINPVDPYGSFGTAPIATVWQRFQLLRKEQSSWEAILNNMAMPTTVIFPPEDVEMWSNEQAERVAKQMSERFRFGQGGGTWVVQDHLQVQTLSTPPKDLSALQLWDQIRTSVCNAYKVPKTLLDMSDNSGTASDTIMRAFQLHGLKFRITNILDTLTHRLCPPRLFFATSDIMQPDRAFELQRVSAAWQANLITKNEGRLGLGYDPTDDGGDKYLYQLIGSNVGQGGTMGTLPSFTGNTAPTPAPKSTTRATKAYKSTTPDPTPLAKALRTIFERQQDAVLNQFKGMDEIETKAWMPPDTWAKRMAEEITPILRVYADQGANGIFGEIGADTGVKLLAVQELDTSVNRLALALADSTTQTTDMKVEYAVEATRSAIRDGLDKGEANDQLRDRIKEIFTDLSERRCMLIAETESSRTKMAGEVIAVKAAGVEAKKVWLKDSLACDLCASLAAKGPISLDELFMTKGTGPYSDVPHPPAHTSCRCSLVYQFDQ